jgi:hypothetical protein
MKQFLKKFLCKLSPQLNYALIALYRRRRDRRPSLNEREFARTEIFNGADLVVLGGPFAGMRYINEHTYGPIALNWLGLYEPHLNGVIQQIVDGPYDGFIDLGAAEGYYAVGIGRARPELNIVTFDLDPFSRASQRRLAALNGVKNIDIRSICTHQNFEDVLGERPFVFCDVDGAELDLIDPNSVPGLRRADLLVEIHSIGKLSVPQVTEIVAQRFSDTHSIRVIGPNAEYAEQARLIKALRQNGVSSKVLDQVAAIRRKDPNNWLVLTLRESKEISEFACESQKR